MDLNKFIPPEVRQFISGLDQSVIYYGGIGIGLGLLLLFIDLFSNAYRTIKKAKRKLNSEGTILEKLEGQFSVLRSHAPTYANSLGGEGAKLINELEKILSEQRDTLELLSELVYEKDLDFINNVFDKEEEFKADKPQWDKRAENIISYLGSKILEASNKSYELGVPKSSRHDTTIISLIKAQIIKPQL